MGLSGSHPPDKTPVHGGSVPLSGPAWDHWSFQSSLCQAAQGNTWCVFIRRNFVPEGTGWQVGTASCPSDAALADTEAPSSPCSQCGDTQRNQIWEQHSGVPLGFDGTGLVLLNS